MSLSVTRHPSYVCSQDRPKPTKKLTSEKLIDFYITLVFALSCLLELESGACAHSKTYEIVVV
jgi:hypothetical protein